MTKSLPESPSLSSLKYEAKQLLKARDAGDESAREVLQLLPKLAGKTNQQILAAKVTLQEVQHALALEYGFESWSSLTRAVQQTKPESTIEIADIRVNLLEYDGEVLDTTPNEPVLGIDIGSSRIKLPPVSG